MYVHFWLFLYVFFLVLKLVIPFMSSILQRSEAFTLTYSYGGGWWRVLGGVCAGCYKSMQWILGRASMQTCDFSIIASWLLLDLHVSAGVFLQVCCVLLGYLSVSMLRYCFCKIIIYHYCLFCMYYFNVVQVFHVMRNSPSCDIFYCIMILKAICLIL